MFIRVKKIKGQRYAYMVQNSWTALGARQKVGKYLGKVIKYEKRFNSTLKELFAIESMPQFVANTELKGIILRLVELELHNHGLPKETFDPLTLTFTEGKKSFVLEINQGFLCQYTLGKVLEYKAEGDEGFKLAELLLAAGFSIEQELFIELFEKLKPKQAAPSSDEFYF